MISKNKSFKLPEPVAGEDYYVDELRRYTVSIDIEVNALYETDGEAEVCLAAINGFRDGTLDGDSQVMHSEKIRDAELDFKTDLPFNRRAWQSAKLLGLGLNENGDPLRLGEKERPKNETTLDDFIFDIRTSRFARIVARLDAWCARCRQAFLEAF